MRRWTAAATAVLALVIGGAIQAEGKGARQRATTLEVRVKVMSSSFVDNTPVGTQPNEIGPGDDQLLAERASRGRVKVGRTLVACKIITRALDSQCSFTLKLAKGDIQYAGFGTRTGAERFSIVGGTGAYSGARGWVLAKAVGSAGSQHDLTFHLK